MLPAVPFGNVKKNLRIVVGDEVELDKIENDSKFVIKQVYPRKNQLVRPVVANIDQLIIVIAPKPQPDLLLVDKLIIYCMMNDIEPIIVLNKVDIMKESEIEDFKNQFKNVATHILITSAVENTNIQELKTLLKGKLSVFAGQSAVGKSSLLNALNLNLNINTNVLSKKIERGKHTTRTVEIYLLENNILIADTPGFSALDLLNFKPDDIKSYYLEFNKFQEECKYLNCSHINEPAAECGVKRALNDGKINVNRYNRYKELYIFYKKKWENRYD